MKTFEELLVKEIRKLPESRVRDAMEYSLCAGGKRIRPTLLYLAATALTAVLQMPMHAHWR